MPYGDGIEVVPLDGVAFAERMRRWQPVGRLLLAVSGGPDSVALMGLAAAGAHHGGPPLAVATVDHRLRPESHMEARKVAEAAAAFGLPHAVLDWRGPPPTTRLQERARVERYALLVEHAREIGATHLATAHTADDQAETVLFRLARGSGVAGLSGMRPSVRRGEIDHLRPLLDVRKATLVATCHANGWSFITDPANSDPRFARTRMRRILADLEPEGLGPEGLARLAGRLLRLQTAMCWAAAAAYATVVRVRDKDRVVLDGRTLLALPEEIFLRVIATALDEAVPRHDVKRMHLQRLERLCGALRTAIGDGGAFSRTIEGALVRAGGGSVTLTPEPPRKNAAHQGSRRPTSQPTTSLMPAVDGGRAAH